MVRSSHSQKIVKFINELKKLDVDDLQTINDYPISHKEFDVSYLKEILDGEDFEFYFKLYLPHVLFYKIEDLINKQYEYRL
jgi:hypothetical protein